MRPILQLRSAFVVVLMCASSALAAVRTEQSALRALKLLPNGEGEQLARVVAMGAAPTPEKWILLVHDPKSETGLKEYVVARGKLLPGGEVSEHATYLTEADVVGRKDVKIDSNRIFEVANAYALANGMLVASMNYTLERNAADGRPVWRVDCMQSKTVRGELLGSVVMSAEDGEVLSHDGFEIAPDLSSAKNKKLTTKRDMKLKTQATPLVASLEQDLLPPAEERITEEAADTAEPVARSGSPSASNGSSSSQSRPKVRRSNRADAGDVARTVTRPARKIIRRILPF